ncbi:hypothetical protein B0684_02780 [Thioalkalivibrio versutus]|nr:hypothetical protein B0684_02780 [Thioalkalivibrio versutus]
MMVHSVTDFAAQEGGRVRRQIALLAAIYRRRQRPGLTPRTCAAGRSIGRGFGVMDSLRASVRTGVLEKPKMKMAQDIPASRPSPAPIRITPLAASVIDLGQHHDPDHYQRDRHQLERIGAFQLQGEGDD